MRSIYLVMSQTGTMLSRTIKFFTGKQYNHISISLDDNLTCMYSFGRKNPNNPFIGVLVEEGINKGTFKKFYKTQCKVIEIELTDEQYESVYQNIKKMLKEKEKYKYNILGLVLALFNIERHHETKFYCSEFVRYILDNSQIDVSKIPTIPHPVDFNILSNKNIYEGQLKNYTLKNSVK